ncbi:MAG: hypothetical protein AB200_02910 [Parcubacteria bacterium C7867-005]|nr:MAG: hypothetical protein AB200_02910 [Parcubacteria bacterium C7867-005]
MKVIFLNTGELEIWIGKSPSERNYTLYFGHGKSGHFKGIWEATDISDNFDSAVGETREILEAIYEECSVCMLENGAGHEAMLSHDMINEIVAKLRRGEVVSREPSPFDAPTG